MTKKRVADLLVDVLAAAGVKRIYGVCGDSLNGITDSIRTRATSHTRVLPPDRTGLAISRLGARLMLCSVLGACGALVADNRNHGAAGQAR